MRDEWRLTVRLFELGDTRELETEASARLRNCSVTRGRGGVQIHVPDDRERIRAERFVRRFLAERHEAVAVRRERWDAEAGDWRDPEHPPEPPENDEERLPTALVWIDADTLRWELKARFPDRGAARAQAARLRDEEPLVVYWLRGRTVSVYTTTEDEARRIGGKIEAPIEVVRPLSRLRAWWMRLHLAGNYDNSGRFERRIVQREWAAAAVDGEIDMDLDLDLDLDLG